MAGGMEVWGGRGAGGETGSGGGGGWWRGGQVRAIYSRGGRWGGGECFSIFVVKVRLGLLLVVWGYWVLNIHNTSERSQP